MTPPVTSLAEPATLIELLARRSRGTGGYVAVAADGRRRTMSFAELFDAVQAGAAVIAGARAADSGATDDGAGTRCAVITVADPLSFIVAFFSAMRAGYTPAPAPSGTAEHPAHRRRFDGIVRSAHPAVIITDLLREREITEAASDSGAVIIAVETLTTTPAAAGSVAFPAGTPEEPAYLQFTSGSTSEPKPAVVLHRHVLAELRLAARVYDESAASVSVHWVPLYHGMGLVCGILRPLYADYRSVILDSTDFLRRPSWWLEQLSAWRATHTSSPTFGYAFTVASADVPSDLDLSSVRVARVSSEMVPYSTLRDFSARFRGAGFDHAAFCPSYGLVEATLAVTSCPVEEEPRVVGISRSAFRGGVASWPDGADDALRLVSSGPPLPETTVRILNGVGDPVDRAGEVGEVWISGPQVVPRDGDEVGGVEGRRTGDLAFLWEGDLVPVGRNTERFKVRGVNFYSSEVETLIPAADPRFPAGRVAAFLDGEPGATDPDLVVVAEVGSNGRFSGAELDDLRRSVVHTVSRSLGLTVARVLLLEPGRLPMTTSGKLRRDACRASYESGELRSLTESAGSTYVES